VAPRISCMFLAVISCVTHLTHTTGSVISVDAGRHL
jgi:hypothetical protein